MSCPECFQGSIHEGQPRGKNIKLHGLDAYVTEPSDGRTVKGIIVVLPDAFGWDFVNCRILADHLSDKGHYKVYLPDFMNGTAASVSMLETMHKATTATNYLTMAYNFFFVLLAFIPFILRNRPGKAYPIVRGFFEQLRKEEGETLPIGAAGYCWGGKFALLLAHGAEINGKPLIDAAFTGHPSLLSLPGDVEKLTLPVSFAIGDRDIQVSLKQAKEIKAIVEAKHGAAKGEVRIYDESSHGFCVRASLQDKDLAQKAADAEDQCIAWFNAQFSIGA
ncbi:hypothetical protein G7046_g6419 [Stylonectria norvegica]|nr:hypothetical protein G7046_g6419 [Stylonectria norvegica]